MKKLIYVLLTLIISIVMIENVSSQVTKEIKTEETVYKDSEKLVVVWTSSDLEVALKMVYMYTYNAKKYSWWKGVTFIIWGPSSKLLAENKELQDYLRKMKDEGIILEACQACADMYGVSDKLIEMGVDVKYMGVALTEYIKGDSHVITF